MMEEKALIVGPDGKEVKSQQFADCPKCGRPPSQRIPSCGFGNSYLICPCGYEFEGKLTCQPVIP